MKEIISMIPAVIVSILLFLISDYFLKKDKRDNLIKFDNNPNYTSYLNTKFKIGKLIAVIMMIILILKVVWIVIIEG